MLRDALQTVAGPAWDLSVNDTTRQVCFDHHFPPSPFSEFAPAPGAIGTPIDAPTVLVEPLGAAKPEDQP